MLIELRSLCPVPLQWVINPAGTTTEHGECILYAGCFTVGWLFINAITDRYVVCAEINGMGRGWGAPVLCGWMQYFDTEEEAKSYLLTTVRLYLQTHSEYRQWVVENMRSSRSRRLTRHPSRIVQAQ